MISKSTLNRQSQTQRIPVLLRECLSKHFGISDPKFHTFIADNCTYLDLITGDVLIQEGDSSDDVYFLLSGRMRALKATANGDHVLGEIGRGETVGELAMFTEQRRTASVVAIRDSIVAQISRATLEKAMGKQPGIALKITQQVIERFKRMDAISKPPSIPVSLTFLPITPGIDARAIAQALAAIRNEKDDDILAIGPTYISETLGGLDTPDTSQPRGPVSLALGDLELKHDALYFIAGPDDMAWSHTAVHHSDEIVLLAYAAHVPDLSEIEQNLFPEDENMRAKMTLVLVHDEDTKAPRNTAKWLESRSVARHVHIRENNVADYRRLSRVLSGRAIGLVLAGGGARGLSHIGIYAALKEMSIEIDMVGGTSAGAIMGSYIAMGIPGDQIVKHTRDVFLNSPYGNISGDYNLIPVLSIIKGHRAWKVTRKAVMDHAGADIDIEDSWKPFYTIASNYSTQSEQVLSRGNFARNVVASFSIPGLMPPTLIDGHIMFDGGTFNNFPVDEMRKRGAGKIIGIDLLSDHVKEFNLTKTPSSMAVLRDKFRRPKNRKYKLPTLPATLLTASVVTSMSRQKSLRKHTDMLFQPNVRGVGMLDWKKYDRVVADAKAMALEQLRAMSEGELKDFRG